MVIGQVMDVWLLIFCIQEFVLVEEWEEEVKFDLEIENVVEMYDVFFIWERIFIQDSEGIVGINIKSKFKFMFGDVSEDVSILVEEWEFFKF